MERQRPAPVNRDFCRRSRPRGNRRPRPGL